MRVQALVLRESLKVDDNDWHFTIPPQYMSLELRRTRMLKVTFSDAGIVLDTDKISSNRILHSDDPTKFILLGIKRTFRFLDHPPKVAVEYLTRMFKAGFFLNDVQYRFYHHSNSQLVRLQLTIRLSYSSPASSANARAS
jgi:regulator of nonsense transcripts 1